jgi:hypothetical protein
MRRVIKPNGFLYLFPAWNCTSWAADGLPVRKYTDLNWSDKLRKLSLPVQGSPPFRASYRVPTRLLRLGFVSMAGGPSRLHYVLLRPNYSKYWMPDSDAVNSIDSYDALLWFTSRGDRCMNCASRLREAFAHTGPLIIQIRKG